MNIRLATLGWVLLAILFLGWFIDPFGSGIGPTTTYSLALPSGEVVTYDTQSVHKSMESWRDYQFYFQKTASRPKEPLGGKFEGPGDPIQLKSAEIHQYPDRVILVVNSIIFSSPDSYVFFHPKPYDRGGWKILYNKRDNFRNFDHLGDDGQTLMEKGNGELVFKITQDGELQPLSPGDRK